MGKNTLLLFALITLPMALFGQFEKQSKYLSSDEGLSQIGINCMYQDSLGYLWIGTSYGLSVYDGYRLENFEPEPGDSSSLSGQDVRNIIEDRHGHIWVTTAFGLSRIDRQSRRITNYTIDNGALPQGYAEGIATDKWGCLWFGTSGCVYRLKDEKIQVFDFDSIAKSIGTYFKFYTGIGADSRGNMWLGTQTDGILRYSIESGKAQIMKRGGEIDLLNDTISNIFCDRSDNLWIAYPTGSFSRYNIRTGHTEHFPQYGFQVNTIYEDAHGSLYIGTDGSGCYEYAQGKWKQYSMANSDFYNDKITAVIRDRQQSMWVAFRHGGIAYYAHTEKPIAAHRYRIGGELPYNLVSDIIADTQGKVWITNDKGGLLVQESSSSGLRSIAPETAVTALCIFEANDGTILCGTYSSGLLTVNPHSYAYQIHRSRANDMNSIAVNDVRAIDQDSAGTIWLALHGYGFASYDQKSGRFRNFSFDDTTDMRYNGSWSSSIACQGDKVWVGTSIGLYCYSQASDQGYFLRSESSQPASLSSNDIFSLFVDSRKHLWIGTAQGANRFNAADSGFTKYFRSDGLADNIISSITEDRSGNIWFGTRNGLSCMTYPEAKFINYTSADGLQGNEFARNAAFCSAKGRLYWGGLEGFSSFIPEEFKYNTQAPDVLITGYKILNDPEWGSKYSVPNPFAEFTFNQNSIGFEFVALNFIKSEKNQYAYRLEGVDAGWIYCGTQRQVNYSNLGPGKYSFRVKACNDDGVWNETGDSFSFRILPPFYLRWYAYAVYLALMLMILYFFRKFSIISVTQKTEMQLEHLEREKIEEIHQAKLRFFTDISHDIRTPLTLIIDPINRMLSNWGNGDNAQKQLFIVQKNANRMLELINQLLDFRKIERGYRPLQCIHADIVPAVSEICSNFAVFLEERSINFIVPDTATKHLCYFDPEKLKKIIANLLSNASKFTPEHGTIEVSITEHAPSKLFEKGCIDISISDTGPGIALSMMRSIFERFRQGTAQADVFVTGSGIGLSLAKNLAEMHRGSLTAQSTLGKGSCFCLRLPLGREHLQAGDIQLPAKAEMPQFLSAHTALAHATKRNRQEIVLLVEDDADILRYLTDVLIDEYAIITASDGAAGLEMALSTVPDIIVTDVQMPEMDGFAMTRMLKENPATSHIPVIMLTAYDMAELRMEGLVSGAVEYLSKPVDSALLRIKMNNLLDLVKQQQIQVKKMFAQQSSAPQEDISAEYVFLGKIQKIIECQLKNSQISVQDLATEMGLSRSQLFRKFKAILNQNPKDFIQSTRLSHAKKLLEQSGLAIKEIAYEVGFSDARYFSRCFLKEFGMSPRAWKKQQTGQDTETEDKDEIE